MTKKGFTLVELVIVILLLGILVGMGAAFIYKPVEGYVALNRRAALVDAAENALRRMQRDIRRAVPNSIRVGCGGECLELMHTVDGGRYRAYIDPLDSLNHGNHLEFSALDSSFEVIGALAQAPSAGNSLAIYNLAATGASGNTYFGDNLAAVDSAASTATLVTLAAPKQFPFSSPYQRFFIVDGPVSYVCAAGRLTRYAGYAPAQSANTPVASMGAGALMANRVAGCNFTYSPGSTQRSGLVSMRLDIADQGEHVYLLHQVHVDNAP